MPTTLTLYKLKPVQAYPARWHVAQRSDEQVTAEQFSHALRALGDRIPTSGSVFLQDEHGEYFELTANSAN